jgi:hypothetical protein
MKKLIYVCIVMLLLALFPMPMFYYTILRITVFIGALVLAFQGLINKNLKIVLVIIAILFNPIIPIYLYDKGVWKLIDIITVIILGYTLHKKIV